MNWSEINEPTKAIPYAYITCETPLGTAQIDWKSWEKVSAYEISVGDIYLGHKWNLEESKKLVEDWLIQIYKDLGDYLEQLKTNKINGGK